ncbi:MAG: hypothetical protein JW704_11310 [Anaerolineaceae bacterium]|nr:hypothetical protein [Anaerolineaceae bacterium]
MPDNEIYVERIHIRCAGDSTAGIPASTWTIEGGFYFDGEDDKLEFYAELEKVFGDFAGDKAWAYADER